MLIWSLHPNLLVSFAQASFRSLHLVRSQFIVVDFTVYSGLPSSEISQNNPPNGSVNRNFRYGIYWTIPGEYSCPASSEYAWQRNPGFFKVKLRVAEVDHCFKKIDPK